MERRALKANDQMRLFEFALQEFFATDISGGFHLRGSCCPERRKARFGFFDNLCMIHSTCRCDNGGGRCIMAREISLNRVAIKRGDALWRAKNGAAQSLARIGCILSLIHI